MFGRKKQKIDCRMQEKPRLVLASDTEAAEAYRSFRNNLKFCMSQRRKKRIVFVSAQDGEGKTATAVNTAVFLAQAGERVVLLDANLRTPAAHRMLGIPRGEDGLSGILSSEDPVRATRAALKETDLPNLALIPAGIIPPNPAELLDGTRMAALLDRLEREFDYLILDSPAMGQYADAMVLAKCGCCFVLTVREGWSNHKQVKQALHSIHMVNGDLLGAVYVDCKPF